LRLLLDEMYPAVAEQLRARGHDVSVVTERQELRSLPDADIFAAAQSERRAVVTENIGDFASIVEGAAVRGEAHFGLVLIDRVKYRRGQRRTIGRLVTGLDRLLIQHPGGQATSLWHWL
jgi:predicted nuclease of predicted toxin-antitoxin system